jgi:hypothetical protein
MNFPVLLFIIITFIVWLQYEIRKSEKHSKKKHDNYWEAERNANLTRSKDISNLNYITISLSKLPMSDHNDSTINSYRDIIRNLSNQKILNLTGLTNTDLKFIYGATNINLLSEYDNNYTHMVSILHKWAERLYARGYTADAVSVLEFAVSRNTDVKKSYTLLAIIYKKQNTPKKIDTLISIIPNTKLRSQDTLLLQLNKIKNMP